MKNLRGGLKLSLFILAAVSVFAACPAKKPSASQSGEAGITITFDQFSGSGDNEIYLKKMIYAYTLENPGVTINLQSYGYDDYFVQLAAKVSAGKAPDVFELNFENFVAYAKKGALEELDALITQAGLDMSVYNKMALDAFSSEGKQYGIPNSFSNVVLIYNKDLFDRAGIPYPNDDWQWADAMAAAVKIRALDSTIFGYYQAASFHEFYKAAVQNGGGFLNSAGTAFTIDSRENEETLRYLGVCCASRIKWYKYS
ncbi:MAG: extracellular solute-binding protein [Treponema sp.]|jgi:multiple sugar transport system substrate-binding protein|nr:extracellular solute-binding protein [Treponema sp.]